MKIGGRTWLSLTSYVYVSTSKIFGGTVVRLVGTYVRKLFVDGRAAFGVLVFVRTCRVKSDADQAWTEGEVKNKKYS